MVSIINTFIHSFITIKIEIIRIEIKIEIEMKMRTADEKINKKFMTATK